MGYGDGRVDLGAPGIDPAHLGIARRNAKEHQRNAQEWRAFAERAQAQTRKAIQQRNRFMAERDAWVATFSKFRKQFAPEVPKEQIFKDFDRFLAEKKSGQG